MILNHQLFYNMEDIILKTVHSKSTTNRDKKTNISYTNNQLRIYIPKIIDIFKLGDEISVIKSLEGFIIKKSGIDNKSRRKFLNTRAINLSNKQPEILDLEGSYQLEVINEDSLKLIKI